MTQRRTILKIAGLTVLGGCTASGRTDLTDIPDADTPDSPDVDVYNTVLERPETDKCPQVVGATLPYRAGVTIRNKDSRDVTGTVEVSFTGPDHTSSTEIEIGIPAGERRTFLTGQDIPCDVNPATVGVDAQITEVGYT